MPSLFARLQQELDVKQHGLGLLRQRIAGSESAQLAEAVKASEQELAEAKEAAAAAQQKRKDMVKAAKVRQLMLQAAGNMLGLLMYEQALLPVAGGMHAHTGVPASTANMSVLPSKPDAAACCWHGGRPAPEAAFCWQHALCQDVAALLSLCVAAPADRMLLPSCCAVLQAAVINAV